MSESIEAVTVYCSSSRHVAGHYLDAARQLGGAIAAAGWKLVYGGNYIGSMAALADGARSSGGSVIGVTPQLLVDKGIADERCDELIVTPSMRGRKELMEQRGDAFIALPGGIGTYEEVFEILVGRQLGYHGKPIVLLNIADYYRPMLQMLDHGLEEKFIRAGTRELLFVTENVSSAIEYLKRHRKTPAPPRPTAQTQSINVD